MRIVYLALLSLFLPAAASTEIKPSFSAESCMWHATEIIVADEGETLDGNVTVKEVWAGTLQTGSTLSLPQLAAFAPVKMRTVQVPYIKEKGTVINGRTVVLFLSKIDGRLEGANRYGTPGRRLNISAAWLHEGRLFAVQQNMNPGEVSMSPLHKHTWSTLKERCLFVSAKKSELDRAKAISDRGRRAAAMAAVIPHLPYEGQEHGLDLIGECGPSGYDSALKVLQGRAENTRRNVYRSLLKCDPDRAVAFLIDVIERETSYFAQHKARLKKGWWNGEAGGFKQAQIDRDHYSNAHRALYVLRHTTDKRLIAPIQTLRDLWQSHAPYNDPSGLNQMAKACQKVLNRQRPR